MLADSRYRPPKWMVNGVDSGELPTKALMIWKYTVERLGAKFSFPAGIAYWRNKCRKEGIDLLKKFQKGGEGATFGAWKIKTGDQIEVWVKERLKSEGLVNDAVRTAAEWELEINHLQDAITDANERISKHRAGLARGNRVKQRQKWLASAEKDLKSASKSMEKARAAVAELSKAAERHESHKAPVVEFEKQFQMSLGLATKDLNKREMLDAARAALAKLEAEVAASEAEEAAAAEQAALMEAAPATQASPEWTGPMPGPAVRPGEIRVVEGAVSDWILGGLKKVWQYVSAAFSDLVNWAKDLTGQTKSLNKMLDKAGAKR